MSLTYDPQAAYFHYVSNETVEGLQFRYLPGLKRVPRVCDMSSDFLSYPFDIKDFSIVYAHAQKNLGPAGLTLVILKDELLKGAPEHLPSMLDYRNHAEMGSIYNTPPVFAIYVTLLIARWLRDSIGGLEKMAALNEKKAQALYGLLDRASRILPGSRSKERPVPDERGFPPAEPRDGPGLPGRCLRRRFLRPGRPPVPGGLKGFPL